MEYFVNKERSWMSVRIRKSVAASVLLPSVDDVEVTADEETEEHLAVDGFFLR